MDKVVELRFNGDYVVSAKAVDKDVITFTQGIDEKTDEVFDVATNVSGVPNMVTLYLSGRTLHTGDRSTGLTFVADAPTVLHQKVRGSWENIEYSSVQEAYDNLADASTAAGLQFQGRIVAVLNNQGVAEWVYIHTETPAEYDPTTGGGTVVDNGFDVIQNNGGFSYTVRYYGNKTNDQIREYVIDVIEDYTGTAVRQYNLLTGELWIEGSWMPMNVTPVQVYAVTGNGNVQYLDKSATRTAIPNMKSGTEYMLSTDSALTTITSDMTANSSGYVYVSKLDSDITLVEAYEVNAGTDVTNLAVGTTTSATKLYVPYNTKVTVTGDTQGSDTYAQFEDATGKALTDPTYVKAGDANVKVVTVTGDVTIREETGSIVTVNGTQLGLFTGSEDFTYESRDVGLKFAAKNNLATTLSTVNVQNGYTFEDSVLSGLTSVSGKIEIVQVAETTATGVTATYKDSAGTDVPLSSSTTNLTIGTTITVTASVLAGQHIQVTVNGVVTDLGSEGNGTSQTITYVVKDTDGTIAFGIG